MKKNCIEYLNGKTWKEITREERYFCAELYRDICHNYIPFLQLLGIDSQENFEVGYEVCFYRDLLKDYNIGVKGSDYSQKRTFDLVLFFPNEIYIIEAKAQQGFDGKQLKSFDKDKENIEEMFKSLNKVSSRKFKIPKITMFAIISSKYTPKDDTAKKFKKIITWKNIFEIYKNPVYMRANGIYES